MVFPLYQEGIKGCVIIMKSRLVLQCKTKPNSINASLFFVGNSNLEGAVKMLLNKKVVNEAIHIASTTLAVDLLL